MAERIYGKGFDAYTPEEQKRIALGRDVAQEGMVLLENNGVLPLKPGFPGMVDWLYKRVQDGTLSRADLEECAGRLLKVVMNSAAMERYLSE